MAFHLSAQNLRVENKHYLVGQLQNSDGHLVDASINLDEFLGNNNGQFQWDSVRFSESAENVYFSVEGDGGIPVLHAELSNIEGEPNEVNINLAERIENYNGQFVFN